MEASVAGSDFIRDTAASAIGSPHSCTKWPPSAISIGGGQLWISACRARITGGPSTGSFMPIAIRLLPAQRSRQKSRASRDSAAPSASGRSGTRLGKRRTPALYEASGKGAA